MRNAIAYKKIIGTFLCSVLVLLTLLDAKTVHATENKEYKLIVHDIVAGDDKGSVTLTKKSGEYVKIMRPVYASTSIIDDGNTWLLQGWYDDISQIKLPDYQYKAIEKSGETTMAILGFYMPDGDLEITAEYSTAPWTVSVTQILDSKTSKSVSLGAGNTNTYPIPEAPNGYTYASAVWEGDLSTYSGNLTSQNTVTIYGNAELYVSYEKTGNENTLTIDGKDKGKFKEGQFITYKYDETKNGKMPGYNMYFDGAGKTSAGLKVITRTVILSDQHQYKVLIFSMPDSPLYIVFNSSKNGNNSQSQDTTPEPTSDNTSQNSGSSAPTGTTQPSNNIKKTPTLGSTPATSKKLSQTEFAALPSKVKSGQYTSKTAAFEPGKGVLKFNQGTKEKIVIYTEDIQNNRTKINEVRDNLGTTNYFVKAEVNGAEHLYLIYSTTGPPDPTKIATIQSKVLLY